jgi:hypothetical protein
VENPRPNRAPSRADSSSMSASPRPARTSPAWRCSTISRPICQYASTISVFTARTTRVRACSRIVAMRSKSSVPADGDTTGPASARARGLLRATGCLAKRVLAEREILVAFLVIAARCDRRRSGRVLLGSSGAASIACFSPARQLRGASAPSTSARGQSLVDVTPSPPCSLPRITFARRPRCSRPIGPGPDKLVLGDPTPSDPPAPPPTSSAVPRRSVVAANLGRSPNNHLCERRQKPNHLGSLGGQPRATLNAREK